jgi:hypothetical protein
MKKSIWAIIGAIVVVVVIVAVVMLSSNKASTHKTSTSSTSANKTASLTYKEYKACDILTPAIAQQIAGADATTNQTLTPEVSTSSVGVTNCDYYSSTTKNSVSLLSRSALDKAGADTNNLQFGSGLPDGAQKVSGYGDSAYWSPSYGQFNILKHNNWYILQAGGLIPANRTLDQAKQYANLIIPSL